VGKTEEKILMAMSKRFGAIAFCSLLFLSGCNDKQPAAGNVKEAEKIVAEARATGPLPDGGFKATVSVTNPPAKMQPGQQETLLVKIKNIGSVSWPAHGRVSDGYYQVNVGDRWLDSKDRAVEKHLYVRSGLPEDLKPGQEVEIQLGITAPDAPGDYTLKIDLVQEMVAWFADKGSSAPTFKVKVGS
jgi:hypothetical protein